VTDIDVARKLLANAGYLVLRAQADETEVAR
jgi:hypothetical protein